MEEGPKSQEILIVQGRQPSFLETASAKDAPRMASVQAVTLAIDRLRQGERPRMILLDLDGPEDLEGLRRMVAHDGRVPIVVTAEPGESDLLVEALSCGADNFLMRPVRREDVEALLARGGKAEGQDTIRRDRLGDDLWFVATNPAMLKIRGQVSQIAPVDVPVLIKGESGVGKEVIARMIHRFSGRREKPFVKVNCAALPGELLESELFGYEQGAFAGAARAKPGKLEIADRGTIFLEEIAEMAPAVQAKLLRVLEDSQFSRLGGRAMIQTDVRVLAATNTPVQEAMRAGRFRKDLYYRLSVFELSVPPLRERREEIGLFFRHFVAKYDGKYGMVCADPPGYVLDAAERYSWPGNLSELEDLVKRYVVLSDAEATFRELVNLARFERRLAIEASAAADGRSLKTRMRDVKDDLELEAILETLEETRWCRKRAAERLGISYKALLNKMRRFHLDGGPGSRAAATAVAGRVPPAGSGRREAILEAKQQ